MKVDKVPGKDNQVDVTLKVEEQNRNQLTFGAGVSQYEGVFGQLAFTEPFLFDRNITGGFDVYKRSLQFIGY
jgi:outer membrane protein assembly factor BamA